MYVYMDVYRVLRKDLSRQKDHEQKDLSRRIGILENKDNLLSEHPDKTVTENF